MGTPPSAALARPAPQQVRSATKNLETSTFYHVWAFHRTLANVSQPWRGKSTGQRSPEVDGRWSACTSLYIGARHICTDCTGQGGSRRRMSAKAPPSD